MIRHLIIFGATGDLTARYLLPALAELHAAGKLPAGFKGVGVAGRAGDTDSFRRHLSEQVARHAATVAPGSREAIVSLLTYHQADVTDGESLRRALGPVTEPAAIYLALPPAVFSPAIQSLAGLDLPPGSRIAIEKPFGLNLASAQVLNRLLHATFPERAIFRLDHFLGLQTVQNILALRFANRVFEPVWSCQHVERVEIIWDETLTVGDRAASYDATGALRDMIQNHLLQVLCLIGLEVPATLGADDLRDRKVDLLRAVRRLSPAEVDRWTVRARYSAGRIGSRAVPAYVQEPGVRPDRATETFAQVTLFIDNERWSGVPFVLRTGKALARDRREISVSFRPVPHSLFPSNVVPGPNVLRLEFEPDRIAYGINTNGSGEALTLDSVDLDHTLAQPVLPAYGHLLLDVLTGDPTLSIRDDEIEESWRIIDQISEAWAAG
ncbi:MAG TPA: glucose-6-phosphate dehydrogenase, partial [Dehalococcoidia bacterium]|nr:glucose-6-phosphate dehydrogenase [Dehalococcoidia bacterium]